MGNEASPSINNLNQLGHKIRRVRGAFLGLDPRTQFESSHKSIATILGAAKASEFMTMQTGQDSWSDQEDLDMPQHTLQRLRDSFGRRSEALWIAQAYDPDSAARVSLRDQGRDRDFDADMNGFSAKYHTLADELGLFPNPPQLEKVILQKQLPMSVRVLAARIMFFDSLKQTKDIHKASAFFVDMLAVAQQTYMKHPVSELQETVQQKSGFQAEAFAKSISPKAWETSEDLSMMCVDRGMRDLIMEYYGIFRDIDTAQDSGYHQGQQLMYMKAVINSCKKVNW